MFEATVLALLPHTVELSSDVVLARLLVFRFVYYVVPRVVAVIWLAVWEVLRRADTLGPGVRKAGHVSASLVLRPEQRD